MFTAPACTKHDTLPRAYIFLTQPYWGSGLDRADAHAQVGLTFFNTPDTPSAVFQRFSALFFTLLA